MNIKKKYVLLGLVLLLIVWIGNIFYYQKHILKEPLFIKDYFDVKQDMQNFRLYYIDNINQKDEVSYISFPEIGEGYTSTDIRDYNSDNRHYRLKIVDVGINAGNDGNVPENLNNKVITKVKVHLINGKTFDVNIGKIYLYGDVPDKPSMESSSSGGSSDNSGYTTFSSKMNLKIYGVTCKFPELMDGLLDISINQVPLKDVKFPINVNKGDNITVGYKFQFDAEDIRWNNAYNCSIDILTEDKMGEKGVNPVFINYWRQFPQEYDIAAMIRDRGDE